MELWMGGRRVGVKMWEGEWWKRGLKRGGFEKG